MYDIGTILKINQPNEYIPRIVTGIVIGYSYKDREPRNVVLFYKDSSYDEGIFGVYTLTTYELATKSEACGKCDLTAFMEASEHLKNLMSFLEKSATNLEEELDTIHRNKRELAEQITKIAKLD